MKRTGLRLLAFATAVLLLLGAVGCGKNNALMRAGEDTLSLNVYELMLSIQKGNMAYAINYWYGDVNSEEFWGTVVDENSTTYDDYYTAAVLRKAKNLLAAASLFREMGLTLSASRTAAIEKEINDLLLEHGSKKALNEALAAYGVNVDMYREYKTLVAKSDELAEAIYGEGGSKIGAMLKEQYLKENYVAFKQILVANYRHVYETDKNGDTIYYLSGGKVAYDTVNGTPRLEDGAFVYYKEDGHIAYDTATGKPSPVLDESGAQKTEPYTGDALLERFNMALELSEMGADGVAAFESLRTMYSDEASIDDNLCYLATNVDYASVNLTFMDDIAAALAELPVGGVTVVESDYGFHVVRRYEVESGAYADNTLAQWFSDSAYGVYDFMNNLENDLFLARLSAYAEKIETDDGLLATVTIKQVNPNYDYR